jgi:hypothetical protein
VTAKMFLKLQLGVVLPIFQLAGHKCVEVLDVEVLYDPLSVFLHLDVWHGDKDPEEIALLFVLA